MTIVSIGARVASRLAGVRFSRWEKRSVDLQRKTFNQLIGKARHTAFGKEHKFASIRSVSDYQDFTGLVPVRDYEGFKPYIDRIIKGEKDVLWPGRPLYFAKTSGTTSGAKHIPITKDSMPNHIDSARNALLMYIYKTRQTDFISGKYIFLSGSPELEKTNDILTGRLSGIVHHHIPRYLRNKRLPSFEINCIDSWEEKLSRIIDETLPLKMSLISGIPPWLEMYFEKILSRTGKKTILDVFPHFSLLVHGGVNFNHYKDKLFKLIGKEIDTIETFPASEGFFAFQDEFPSEGLLLIPDSGIFYEFIPVDQFHHDQPPRLWLDQVETGVNYAMILNTNAGLWGYNIGDTVRFVSKNPYRLEVSGRLTHYTSAFGEHVIAEEAESAIEEAAQRTRSMVREFTLAPLIHNPDGLPCHQWFVEFKRQPCKMDEFSRILDEVMQRKNTYYKDLIKGHILQPAMVIKVPRGTFTKYMKSVGKLGGQNKVQHLSNDRDMAELILKMI